MSIRPSIAHSRALATRDVVPTAYDVLGAETHAEAVAAAVSVIERAPRCGCCISHRVHFIRYIGSTLFLDDDPRRLAAALPFCERTVWTARLLAACIVLHGRARVSRS